jgi:DNA polymerase III gamma/tau subunit
MTANIAKFLEQIALYSFTHKVFLKELASFAQSFIPILAKSSINESLTTIKALSFICDQSYLTRVIQKNVDRLLKSDKDWKRTMEVLIEVLTGSAMDANLYGNL